MKQTNKQNSQSWKENEKSLETKYYILCEIEIGSKTKTEIAMIFKFQKVRSRV
jgi:hypothetical protein